VNIPPLIEDDDAEKDQNELTNIKIQGGAFLYALALSDINQFSKLFHYRKHEKICNNTITKDPNNSKQYDFCNSTTH